MTRRRSTCRGNTCGADILWLKTKSFKPIPLDADPTPNGSYVIEGVGEHSVAVYIGERSDYCGERYTPHWATCPDRNDFRKEKS